MRSSASGQSLREADIRFVIHVGRAAGGALFFSLPILMTMEVWHLGFFMDRFRLALLLFSFVFILACLNRLAGFESTYRAKDDVRAAFVALAVGFAVSAAILALLGVLTHGMPVREIVGKIALLAVPASLGASLARSQLGGSKPDTDETEPHGRYAEELFLMGAGALFFAFNIAPTDEIVVIVSAMRAGHLVALAGLSMLLMHLIVYRVEFKGRERPPPGSSPTSVFLRFTVTGYAIALLTSAWMLWSFGRSDGTASDRFLRMVFVLGFPASLGASAARLVM